MKSHISQGTSRKCATIALDERLLFAHGFRIEKRIGSAEDLGQEREERELHREPILRAVIK